MNVTTGQEVKKLKGLTSWVIAVAFSPDGLVFASASDDKTVRVWNAKTGQAMRTLEDVGYIFKLSFTPANSFLVTNRGLLQINLASALILLQDAGVDHNLVLMHDWIEHCGDKILWLPQEYRSGVFALAGNTFGIGCNNGSVAFLRIKYP